MGLVDSINWMAVAFYVLAAHIVVSALLVVCVRNIVHSVLWLAVCFVAMAGLFLTLDADFLAAVQVMVYAGAVCIMVVFGIMLIRRSDMGHSNLFNGQTKIAGGVVALVIVLCGALSARTQWLLSPNEVPAETVDNIATLLLSKYVIPFEVAALLLLVALIGAIILAKEVTVDATDSER
ncbi:NADH-ubiquinone oxidoreductase chain J [Desulfocucumis palustris]|uniref:NADH-quinone oxidoreductase subunit J n=1 Tax=Desulfocucumis palustris TaxID=1898651 RepID=A0A2L2XB47_9FIRM|nr:NADH-ubiquinone oxidoreductase chain J [Desulfocucumis palustris]